MTFLPKQGRQYNRISPDKKANYKKLYLSGLSISEVSKSLGGVGARTVYHHLQPLTPNEKAEHAKNLAIRQDAARKARKNDTG